jgi:hypothetical protein
LLAVDRAAEFEVVRVVEVVDSDEPRTHRPEPGIGLTEAELRRCRGHLQDTFGQVLTDGQPGDVPPGVGGGHVARGPADDDDEFDLPIGVPIGRQDDLAVRGR